MKEKPLIRLTRGKINSIKTKLQKYAAVLWTGFKWLRTDSRCELLRTRHYTFGVQMEFLYLLGDSPLITDSCSLQFGKQHSQ